MSKKIAISIVVFILFIPLYYTICVGYELKTISADSIMKLIKQGKPVELESVRVVGNIDLKNIYLDKKEARDGEKRKAVESEIYINNSTFSDTLYFSNILFTNTVTIIHTIFESPVYLVSYFDKTVTLKDVNFEKKVTFKSSVFVENTTFEKVRFKDEVDFSGITFFSLTNFSYCIFDTIALFHRATFHENVRFEANTFKIFVNFAETYYKKKVHFVLSDFRSSVSFASANFDWETNFLCSSFRDSINFTNTYLQTLRISWEQIKGRLIYDLRVYSFLIKNFKELGQYEDADEAYYEYRVRKRERKTNAWYNPIGLLEYIFLDFNCGYGTKPFWAIRFSVILILFFSLFYVWNGAIKERDGSKQRRISRLGRIRRRWKSEYKQLNFFSRIGTAIYFSVNTFTTVGFGDWYPAKPYSKVIAVIEGFLGWIMLSLFLITLARTWIR